MSSLSWIALALDLYGCGNGGGGEIRTHGRVTPTAVFKTAALNRSATPPFLQNLQAESYLLACFLASCRTSNLSVKLKNYWS